MLTDKFGLYKLMLQLHVYTYTYIFSYVYIFKIKWLLIRNALSSHGSLSCKKSQTFQKLIPPQATPNPDEFSYDFSQICVQVNNAMNDFN